MYMFKKLKLILVLICNVLLVFGSIFMFKASNLIQFVFSILLPVLFFFNTILCVCFLLRRKKTYILFLISIVIFVLKFDSFFQLNLPISMSSDVNTLAVLSYNVNSVTNSRRDKVISFINQTNPDILCFQESEKDFKDDLKSYQFVFKPKKSTLAIYSKYPIFNSGYINFPASLNGALYIDIKINNDSLRIYNLHLQSFKVPLKFFDHKEMRSYSLLTSRIRKAEKIRANQVITVKKHIDKFKGKVVICGDFNSTQYSLTYNFLKSFRKDSFIEAGFGLGTTYNLYNFPFRIDYILVDKTIKILSHQNFKLRISDHEPILSTLKPN